VVVAAGYFGSKVGQVYWRFYQYQDAMNQQAHFAETVNDEQIRKRLISKADSLSLPNDAADVTVVRTGRHIDLSADYTEKVELPMYVRTFHFTPKAEYDY
jgi:hypothetical protein